MLLIERGKILDHFGKPGTDRAGHIRAAVNGALIDCPVNFFRCACEVLPALLDRRTQLFLQPFPSFFEPRLQSLDLPDARVSRSRNIACRLGERCLKSLQFAYPDVEFPHRAQHLAKFFPLLAEAENCLGLVAGPRKF
jgi:hypothetical protein